MDYLPQFKEKFKGFKIRRSFKENIDPEEILIDTEKPLDLQDQKLETPLRARVFVIFFGIIIIGLAVLLFRSGYFQFLKSEDYLKLAQRNSVRIYPVLAPRGIIYDKNLTPLVNNLPSYNVFLTPQDLPKDKMERETMIEQISFLLDLNPKEVTKEISDFSNSFSSLPLANSFDSLFCSAFIVSDSAIKPRRFSSNCKSRSISTSINFFLTASFTKSLFSRMNFISNIVILSYTKNKFRARV